MQHCTLGGNRNISSHQRTPVGVCRRMHNTVQCEYSYACVSLWECVCVYMPAPSLSLVFALRLCMHAYAVLLPACASL